ncbi:MAG: hypothetical protein ACOY58_03670, partial [Candidatus Micrarchaeota archaeon]
IETALAALKWRQFSFKNCPAIMKMAMDADGRDRLEGSARHQIMIRHETAIKRLIDGLPLEEQVLAIEKYLRSLAADITAKIRKPMAGKEPKTDRLD